MLYLLGDPVDERGREREVGKRGRKGGRKGGRG
jgi:hypothetical protein